MSDLKLDRLKVEGYTGFSIKDYDTEENRAVHKAFWEFCRVETNNNYTQGIRKLLEYYQNDAKYVALWDEIQALRAELEQLKGSLKKPAKEEQEEDMF